MLERATFTFTHSQKKGIFLLALILLVALCTLLGFNYFYSQTPYHAQAVFEQEFAQPVTVIDSSIRLDINVADSSAWVSLHGISPRVGARIVRYRQAIGGFRTVDQVSKVYGLKPQVFQQIKPYLYYTRFSSPISQKTQKPKPVRTQNKPYPKIDINTASVEDFEQLPGIGKILSKRIVKYRNTLGGFSNIEELKRVYYLEPSTFEQIKPYLSVGVPASLFAEEPEINKEKEALSNYFAEASVPKEESPRGNSRGDLAELQLSPSGPKTSISKPKREVPVININQADSASLALLPGLDEKLTKRIVKYRKLLGFFYSVDQLKQVYGLSPEVFSQILPYLRVDGIDKFPKKDLNIAFARNLAYYPFIDKTLAEAIVKERKSLGHFKSWEEVLAIPGVSSEILRKLRIYFEL